MTTFHSYGGVQGARQSEILLHELARTRASALSGHPDVLELVRRLNDHLAAST